MRVLPITMIAVAIATSACAAQDDSDEATKKTEDPFVERPWSDVLGSSLIEPATRGPIRVRIVNTAAMTKPWADWMRWGVGRWVHALRNLPGGSTLSSYVQFVDSGEDLTLFVHAGDGRAFYVPGNPLGQQHIEVWEGDSRGVKVLVHELGHAFGLGDTYVEGTWLCAPEQPTAVMCNADTDDLRADDIRGVRFEYCKRTKRCDPHDYRDTYGGGGGNVFRETCNENERLVGFYARWGSFVDSLTPLCESVSTHARRVLPRVGGDGGQFGQWLVCPAYRYVSAVHVRAGDYLDNLQIECNDGTTSINVGGYGGTQATYACPIGFDAAVGIRGGAGSYVDRLGLSCDGSTGATFSARTSLLLPK